MAVRALVCDDSPLMRRVLRDALTEGGVEVVGDAHDGTQLVAKVRALRPQVVTLDVEMPGLSGLEALRRLMREAPTPVVMVSSLTGRGTRETVDALSSGAVDAVQKPTATATVAWRQDLVRRVRAAASARVGRGGGAPAAAPPPAALARRAGSPPGPLVVIATSTGGPRALATVVPGLPAPLGAGVLIVQHMPVGFTRSLAERLDAGARLDVREAAGGEPIRPGGAIVAQAGRHLEVSRQGQVRLSEAPPIGALRPRADVTLESAARHYGDRVVAVILTGMGNDGESGARAVKDAGGRVLAEDERTCVVWGMPRAVTSAGLADAVVPLDRMAVAIAEAAAG